MQVISRKLADRRESTKIVAVDLQEMAPIEGVIQIQVRDFDVFTCVYVVCMHICVCVHFL